MRGAWRPLRRRDRAKYPVLTPPLGLLRLGLVRLLLRTSRLDRRLRLLWFHSGRSHSLWGLVLGLALVIIYDDNRMVGVFVLFFIIIINLYIIYIMFFFMSRVAPP